MSASSAQVNPTSPDSAEPGVKPVSGPRAVCDPVSVVVVDDDLAIRESLGSLLRSVGLQAKLVGSAPEFLSVGRPKGPTCLVLDVRLPGRSGLDFQRDLADANIHLPIIFITGHGDIPMTVQAMKGGVIEFLTKPFRDQDLLDAIQVGLARDRAWLQNEQESTALQARFNTLTPREREVMALVVTGRLNKQIAGDIGVSEITVKVHRGQVMRKMGASSLPDLVRMTPRLRQAVQRAQLGAAEPNPVSLKTSSPSRGALASALQAQPARPDRDVPHPRHRVVVGVEHQRASPGR